MAYDPVGVALQRHRQLTEQSPYNRSEVPSGAKAQMLSLEQAFSSQLPDQWAALQESEDWKQLQADSPLHPEQFEALARRFADQAE